MAGPRVLTRFEDSLVFSVAGQHPHESCLALWRSIVWSAPAAWPRFLRHVSQKGQVKLQLQHTQCLGVFLHILAHILDTAQLEGQ